MSQPLRTVLCLLSLAGAALSQAPAEGDARATTDLNRNQPTKSWTQWQPKATYALSQLPDQYMGSNRIEKGEGGLPGGEPQTGYNTCAADTWNQDSGCQTAWVNSLLDFCLWAPAEYGTIGEKERSGVAYCTTAKHGTRLIPDGTIKGAHFVRTRDYVQVTGVGDFTSMLIPPGDDGGEFDPHGADDLGNPIGGVLYTTANPASNGAPFFVSEWTNFMSADQFCVRACWGQRAAAQCQHIYDIMGCRWNIPANYDPDVFESCQGEPAQLQGIYDGSTFRQGDPVTPLAHPAPASSQCSSVTSLSHGLLAAAAPSASPSTSSDPAAATSSVQSSGSATLTRLSTAVAASSASSTANANSNANSNTASTSSAGSASASNSASDLSSFLPSLAAALVVATACLLA